MYANIAQQPVSVVEGCVTAETAVEVVVYSKPACMQCTLTYRELDKQRVAYRVVDVTGDEAALAYVKGLGYLGAPVVVVSDTEHWVGFRPDRIGELACELEQARA